MVLIPIILYGIDSNNTLWYRSKVEIVDPDVPTKYFGTTQIDSSTNQFVTFDSTSARKDVSTSTGICFI